MSPIDGCIYVIPKCEGDCNCAPKRLRLVKMEDYADVPEFYALDNAQAEYMAADSEEPLLLESFGGSSSTPTNDTNRFRSLIIMGEEMAKYADGAAK